MSSRVLMVVLSDSGHLNPMIGIAQHLEQRGADVILASCQNDVSERARRAGLKAKCVLARGATPTVAAESAIPASLQFRRRLDKPAWQRHWLSRAVFDGVAEHVERLTAVVQDWQPDLITVDPMIYAGVIVAERANIPWASIATAFNPLTPPDWPSTWVAIFEHLADARAKLERDYGVRLRVRTSDAVSPWLNTVFAVEELVPRELAQNDFSFYVGPSKPIGTRGDEGNFDWSWLRPELPLVYVSFGSLMSPEPETLHTIASAFEEAQVVVVAKDVPLGPLPTSVRTIEYAPQIALLSKASVMIGHGGCNGVLESLTSSTPLLVVPLAYDQPMNGELVRRAGAGHALPPSEVTRERVRELVVPMLRSEAPERAAAERIGAACRRQDGAANTTDLLEQLMQSRVPLRP